ncbi:bordetella uptake domain-containing protein (plasmid) [Rhizobium etli bv. phaseoli str. IE4803]|nr:bordetella uptake domain-containing protein [Rhizobium etli bv. phaseoli str. IE4803]
MHQPKFSKRALGLLTASLIAVSACPALAEYPERPIHLIVGAAAGDNSDIFARLLADKMTKSLGQPVVVENKPGAGGALSGSSVAGAAADGYTLLYGNMSSLVVAPQVMTATYDATKAFTPIAKTQQGASILVAHRDLPVSNATELVEYAKKNPEQVLAAVNALGSTAHLAMELIQVKSGAKFATIPYKGTSAATQAVVTGESGITITGILLAKPHIDSGDLKPIAIYGASASDHFPGVRTIADELSIPELDQDFWFGVVGPAGLEPAVVEKLAASIHGAMQSPDLQEMVEKNGQRYVASTPAEMGQEIAKQWADFGTIIRERGIKVE